MIIQLQYCPLLIQISDIASLVLILLFGHFAFIRETGNVRSKSRHAGQEVRRTISAGDICVPALPKLM